MRRLGTTHQRHTPLAGIDRKPVQARSCLGRGSDGDMGAAPMQDVDIAQFHGSQASAAGGQFVMAVSLAGSKPPGE
jgi:hypothetical protein